MPLLCTLCHQSESVCSAHQLCGITPPIVFLAAPAQHLSKLLCNPRLQKYPAQETLDQSATRFRAAEQLEALCL
jgi:hypothetical protein